MHFNVSIMDNNEHLDIQVRTNNEDSTTEASQVTALSLNTGTYPGSDNDALTCPSTTNSSLRSSTNSDVHKMPTLSDFAEQIRQLEIEGNKLRTANVSSLGNLNELGFDANDFEIPKHQQPVLCNLSTLIDISADQKYIADLRVQLEKQSKETERLQKQLLGDMSNFHSDNYSSYNVNSNGSGHYLPHSQLQQHKPAFSTIPTNDIHQIFNRRFYDYEPPSHLERSLKESQEQMMDLRKKLQTITETSEMQKKQFRKSVEDLKSKLHDTILNRDTVLDLRQKESNSQELLISKLQSSLIEIQEKYKMQEEVAASLSKKLETHNQSSSMIEVALSRIRSVLFERQRKHGHAYFENNPAGGQSVAILADSLDKCLQELDYEVKVKSSRVSELETEISSIKGSSAERERTLAQDYQTSITQLYAEHEKTLADVRETASVAKLQVTKLQNEIQENETVNQQKIKTQELKIKELEDNIDELKTDNMKAKVLWQEKHQALESNLDEMQRELIETKVDKNNLIQSEAVLRSQIDDFQSLVKSLESEIETERDRVQQQRTREEDLRSQVMELEIVITNKQGDIDRLEKMLDVVKQECSATVSDKVASVEKLERNRYLDQIKYLSTQLSTMSEKCNKAVVEHQLGRSEMDSLKTQVCDLTNKLEEARSKMESALTKKNELSALLGDRHESLDKLQRDKEFYEKLAEQRADEVAELNISVDRLKTCLDEKEKILSTFRQQSCNINQLMEVNAKTSEIMREERDKLTLVLSERTDQIEELKSVHDSLNKKVKSSEKRIMSLEDEVLKMSEEIVSKNQELETLHQKKENILKELKESRVEVANLISSQDVLKKEVAKVKSLRLKEMNKLQMKLKESEQEYKLSQKALRSKDIVDHRAVKFADKIQKEMTVKRSEIDQLLSKIHRLEEDLETVTKEKSLLEKDKDSLKRGLAKSLVHTKELSAELEKSDNRKRELVVQVTRLEEELEQTILRAKTSSAMVDKFEREISTLKLKHHLDLKDTERLARIKKGGTFLCTAPGSYSTSTDSLGRNKNSNVSNKSGNVQKELSSLTNYVYESETPLTLNSLQKVDVKHTNYSEVGNELKSLVVDMKHLISVPDQATDKVATVFCNERTEISKDAQKENKDLNMFWTKPVQVNDFRLDNKTENKDLQTQTTDLNKSWSSKSLSKLCDLSDFSSHKDWRPRSNSLTRNRQLSPIDLNLSADTDVIITKGGDCLSSSHKKTNYAEKGTVLLPNTKELCRRLEEKIDSLTRMGGNLVKENKEMAELIDQQGQKLSTVKQRNTRKKR